MIQEIFAEIETYQKTGSFSAVKGSATTEELYGNRGQRLENLSKTRDSPCFTGKGYIWDKFYSRVL